MYITAAAVCSASCSAVLVLLLSLLLLCRNYSNNAQVRIEHYSDIASIPD